jgi:hypothetical protein
MLFSTHLAFPDTYYLVGKIKSHFMFKNFKASEMLIVVFVLVIICVSEYNYIVIGDKDKAIFIGLWPPTILGLLNFINSKIKK